MQRKSTLRSSTSALIIKHRWLPGISTLACALAFGGAVVKPTHLYGLLGTAAALACACFVWGYSARAFKGIHYPVLLHLPRRKYAEVWDSLAASPSLARSAACGPQSESAVRRSAEIPVKNLTELGGVRPEDDILEIGCGVARIGLEIAPRCRTWTGVDMSAKMLACATERLQGTSNARLVKLHQVGLDEVGSNSFDLVYSTGVLGHLDEMDRWRYVKDGFRVLRPGGRLFIDNLDLESEEAWGAFARDSNAAQELERPPYSPRFSTAAEFTTYALRAGFIKIQAHRRTPLVIVTAIKPGSAPTQ